jgi:hypothetical protein
MKLENQKLTSKEIAKIPMKGSDEQISSLVYVHMEEYKSLTSEMLKRIEFQERILSYTVLILGAFMTILSTDWAKNNYNLLLLLAPMAFYALGLVYAFNDNSIINIARYINKFLRSHLKNLLNDDHILGYEDYQYSQRVKSSHKTLGVISSLLQGSFPILVPVTVLSYFLYLNKGLYCVSRSELVTFIFDVFFGIITILIRIKFWNQNWKSIVK